MAARDTDVPDSGMAPQVRQAGLPATQSSPTGAGLSPVAWIPPNELEFDDWCRYGARLGVAGRGSAWWIGDWLSYGVVAYGQRYTVAVRVTGYDHQTLMNMVYVAKRFEASRRRPTLSWSHHAELAPLEITEQELWLDRACSRRLTVRALRAELALAHGGREARSKPHPCRGDHDLAPSGSRHEERQETAGREQGFVCPNCGVTLQRPNDVLTA
jgi:hypothetical protein